MKKTLLLIFTFCATFSFGQSVRLAEADDFYNLIAYASAAEIYTELGDATRAGADLCLYQLPNPSHSNFVARLGSYGPRLDPC